LLQTVGAVSGTVGYTYTRFGAVESVTDGLGTRSFAFADGSLALLSETLPAYYNHAGAGGGTPRVLGYEYSTTGTGADVAGRLARTGLGTATDPFAEQSDAYAYTTDGRLASLNARGVADGTGGHAWSRQFDYGYHELSPGLVTSVAESVSGYAIDRGTELWTGEKCIRARPVSTTMSDDCSMASTQCGQMLVRHMPRASRRSCTWLKERWGRNETPYLLNE
jgi:hypothetical protein